MSKPKIVCLCGSTRFKAEYEYHTKRLALEGRIVLSVGYFGHIDGEPTEEEKGHLDELHLRKIDLAEEILVICPDDYIGKSTRREIEYAKLNGKIVRHSNYKVPDSPPASHKDVAEEIRIMLRDYQGLMFVCQARDYEVLLKNRDTQRSLKLSWDEWQDKINKVEEILSRHYKPLSSGKVHDVAEFYKDDEDVDPAQGLVGEIRNIIKELKGYESDANCKYSLGKLDAYSNVVNKLRAALDGEGDHL
jgi:hypothetical protein